MIGNLLRPTRKASRPTEPRQPSAAERLDHERSKVAKLKARLEAERARVDGLNAALSTLWAERKALGQRYEQLRKQLRWHWAAYPEARSNWKARGAKTDPFADRALMLKARLVDLMASSEFAVEDRRVTAVVTSCQRHDLLEQTLKSFFEADTHPDTKMIVVEDGERDPDDGVKAAFADRPIEWINTGGRVGQIRAIDLAYSRVETPYIFHLEDDWRFLRPGFMEKSIAILEGEPLCLQVALRAAAGWEPVDRTTNGASWRPVKRDVEIFWHGFTFNPGLRRLRDYRLVGRYADVAESGRGKAGTAEAQLSELYGSVGYFAALLWEDDGAAFVGHIGRGRHVT